MWPTNMPARLTMRREMPPAFINSPASMNSGTAISVKLLAPDSMFCARICGSKKFSWNIKATALSNKAKAIGMPRAMSPSNTTRNRVRVMARCAEEAGSRGSDERVFGAGVQRRRAAGQHPRQVDQGQHAHGDGGIQHRGVEHGHGQPGDRQARIQPDDRLLPAAFGHQPQYP